MEKVKCTNCQRLGEPDNTRINRVGYIVTNNTDKLYQCKSRLHQAYIPESSVDKKYPCKLFKLKEQTNNEKVYTNRK